MNSPVEILLSTYNGEKYLNAQLDSILAQDYPHWKMTIRDDGSNDSTLSIINSYIQQYPDKIAVVKDEDGNLGYSNSFTKLLKQSSADYVMFCDQDDYWQPSKISTMLSVMLEEEALRPAKAHIVFSDIQVADAELKIISESFLDMTGYSPDRGNQIFFLKNYVPGCNLLFNRKLVEEALKTKNIINLHDHWLMMVCSAIGKLTVIDKPLLKYRMHDTNAIGFFEQAKPLAERISICMKDILKYGMSNKKYRDKAYSINVAQMQNICEQLSSLVSKDALVFSKVDNSGYFSRKMKNIINPYLLERSVLKQLTYIICF
ncbi:MAG TPA: glycosyltransferase family 2 protein [Bacteroidia bacterium]|jgi:glycosyltransferase involved in cell wall biosynthesis|nr:glycosyltransferase family 2 protein [Bacteroidia bacterium]